jgi:DNA-directed RNA polymerase subunit M/transcription elongation factor TFIIS
LPLRGSEAGWLGRPHTQQRSKKGISAPPAAPPAPTARRAVNQLAKIPDDVVDDASLLRSTAIVCPLCATADGVMIQAKPLATDDKIKVILVCCGCRHKWQI